MFCFIQLTSEDIVLRDAGHLSSSLVVLEYWDGRIYHKGLYFNIVIYILDIYSYICFIYNSNSLNCLIIDYFVSETLYTGFINLVDQFFFNTKPEKSTEEASVICILYIFRERNYND